jgi:hypothetical protein
MAHVPEHRVIFPEILLQSVNELDPNRIMITWSKAIPKSICIISPVILSRRMFALCLSPMPSTCPTMDVVATLLV